MMSSLLISCSKKKEKHTVQIKKVGIFETIKIKLDEYKNNIIDEDDLLEFLLDENYELILLSYKKEKNENIVVDLFSTIHTILIAKLDHSSLEILNSLDYALAFYSKILEDNFSKRVKYMTVKMSYDYLNKYVEVDENNQFDPNHEIICQMLIENIFLIEDNTVEYNELYKGILASRFWVVIEKLKLQHSKNSLKYFTYAIKNKGLSKDESLYFDDKKDQVYEAFKANNINSIRLANAVSYADVKPLLVVLFGERKHKIEASVENISKNIANTIGKTNRYIFDYFLENQDDYLYEKIVNHNLNLLNHPTGNGLKDGFVREKAILKISSFIRKMPLGFVEKLYGSNRKIFMKSKHSAISHMQLEHLLSKYGGVALKSSNVKITQNQINVLKQKICQSSVNLNNESEWLDSMSKFLENMKLKKVVLPQVYAKSMIQTLLLTKTNQYCKKLNYKNDEEKLSNLRSTIMEGYPVNYISFWPAFMIYGDAYLFQLQREIGIDKSSNQEGEIISRYLGKNTVFTYNYKKQGRGGSQLNSFAVGVLLNHLKGDYKTKLKYARHYFSNDVLDKCKTLGYFDKVGHGERGEGRSVLVYLALANSKNAPKKALECLEKHVSNYWDVAFTEFLAHSNREGTHITNYQPKDGEGNKINSEVAPYYFWPSLAYFSSALKVLKKSKFSGESNKASYALMQNHILNLIYSLGAKSKTDPFESLSQSYKYGRFEMTPVFGSFALLPILFEDDFGIITNENN